MLRELIGIAAGTPGLADDEYLDRAEPAHADTNIEIFVHAADGGSNRVLHLGEFQAGQTDPSHLGKEHIAGAVNRQGLVKTYLAPRADVDLISWPECVVGFYRHLIQRRKRSWHVFEQPGAP